MEISPAILAHTEEEFVNKVERVRGLGQMLHIDIMDGIFVPNNTWAPIERVPKIAGDLPFSVHLMVSNPEHAAPVWAVSGAARVFFHVEATEKETLIVRAIAENDDGTHTIGVTINPDTPISRLVPILPRISHILVMGVEPGFAGQQFRPITLDKLRELRRLKPDLTLLVDGGIKHGNIKSIAEAGADAAIIGSALTDVEDPMAAYQEFRKALE